jgi:putative ABC transport system permease protein
MLTNYLKTAWRFLIKNISFSVINIIGLSTGIIAFLLIALYLQNELSYDRHFPEAERTFRVIGIQEPRGLDKQHVAFTSGAWAGFIKENIAGVETAFRIMSGPPANIEVEGKAFRETRLYYSENEVLYYMGFTLLHGTDQRVSLSEPNQALISRQSALRIFGREDVVGETFRNGDRLFNIIGVFENEGIKTHFEVNIFLSLATIEPIETQLQNFASNMVATYVVLHERTDKTMVEKIISDHYKDLLQQDSYSSSMPITFYFQNVRDCYLRSGHLKFHMHSNSGNINNVYIFSLVAVLILVIASINFINLATANSAKRAREVGLRKVLGAGQGKLAVQFIGESMLITFISLVIAMGLLELLLPGFNTLLNTELGIQIFRNPLFNIGLLLLFLILGFISGIYPAIYLSRFQAIEVLKSQSASGKPKAAWLRKTLVIFQFFISTSMIMATLVILNQVDFLLKKDRGYDPQNVITIPAGFGSTYEQLANFRNHLLTLPEVQSVGIASNYNGVAGIQSDIVVADSVNTRQMVRYGFVDPDFFPTMGIEIVEGRNFSHEAGTDIHQAIIINESAAKALGWGNAIGKRFLNRNNPDYDYFTVIGVVKDYHFYSLQTPIEPAVYIFLPSQMPWLNIRYSTNDPQEVVNRIQESFEYFFPGQFFTSHFLDEILGRQISTERNISKIFSLFSFLCIVISCMGLFGLTSFMVNQRRKEISLRKVLGASVSKINLMLLAGFLRWVAIAAIIALPLTYSLLNRWLSNYPYRIDIGILHFVIPLVTIVFISATTILSLSTRAARQNPAENLKYE